MGLSKYQAKCILMLKKQAAGFVRQCACEESHCKSRAEKGFKNIQSRMRHPCRLSATHFGAKEGTKTFLL